MRRIATSLLDNHAEKLAPAWLIVDPSRPFIIEASALWESFTLKHAVAHKEHLHWNWDGKFLLSTTKRNCRWFGIECRKQTLGAHAHDDRRNVPALTR